MLGFTYICVDLASILVSRLVVYAAMTAVCSLLLLTHWVVTDCSILTASALYCAATVRLVAVSYKLHWSSRTLADNLQLRRVGGCVRLTRVRNHARLSRVTLVTNNHGYYFYHGYYFWSCYRDSCFLFVCTTLNLHCLSLYPLLVE